MIITLHYDFFRFEEYLDISPCLFPLNCLKSVSAEIKLLKDHLCEVRSNLLEVYTHTCIYVDAKIYACCYPSCKM